MWGTTAFVPVSLFFRQKERLFFVVCLTVTNLLDQEDFRNSLPDQVRLGVQ